MDIVPRSPSDPGPATGGASDERDGIASVVWMAHWKRRRSVALPLDGRDEDVASFGLSHHEPRRRAARDLAVSALTVPGPVHLAPTGGLVTARREALRALLQAVFSEGPDET